MKRALFIFFIILTWMLPLNLSFCDDFLGAPLPEKKKITLREEGRLEFIVPDAFDNVVGFYKEALKKEKNIRFRNWKEAIYIEDDGALKWHSITIYRDDKAGTKVVILKDNWTWIMGTLFLRYVGVFCVLILLYIALSISGGALSRLLREEEKDK